MDDLIARLRALSSSPARDNAGLGDYWNALDEAADALETCRQKALDDAALKCDELAAKYLRKQSEARRVDAVNMFEDRAAAAVICGRAIRAMK